MLSILFFAYQPIQWIEKVYKVTDFYLRLYLEGVTDLLLPMAHALKRLRIK